MRRVLAHVDGSDVSLRIMDQTGSAAVTLEHHNVVSQGDDFVYLDVGRWGGSDRYFGVVYGNGDESYVLLCAYAAQSGRVRDLPGQAAYGSVDGVIRSFLNACRSRIVDGARFITVDTAGKLYLLLGDLHLPLVNHLCNTWTNRSSGLPEVACRVDHPYMDSLDPEAWQDYFSLRGIANAGVLSGAPGLERFELLFIDAWYETYLENDIFTDPSSNAAAQDLQRFLSLALNWQQSADSLADHVPVHFVQLGDMYELWVGLKRLFEATDSNERQVRIANPTCLRDGGSRDNCDTYRTSHCQTRASQDVIRDWVRKVHENTAVRVGSSEVGLCQWLYDSAEFRNCTWLVGNHDNYLRPLSNSLGLPRRMMNLYENQVLLEHGHEGDEYNRDGAASGHDITQGGAFLWNLRPFVALGEDDQRRNFLRYSIRKFIDPDINIKFFGMAHTHLPYLAVVTVT